MANHCSVCTHPERSTIDARLIAGESRRQIGTDYDLTEASVRRHHQAHVIDAPREDDPIMEPVTTTEPSPMGGTTPPADSFSDFMAAVDALPDAPVEATTTDAVSTLPAGTRTVAVVRVEQELVDQALRKAMASGADRPSLKAYILTERWHALEVERLTLEIDAQIPIAEAATAAVVPVADVFRDVEATYQAARNAFEEAQRTLDQHERVAWRHRSRLGDLRRALNKAQQTLSTAQERLAESEREAGVRHRDDLRDPVDVQRLGRVAQAMTTP